MTKQLADVTGEKVGSGTTVAVICSIDLFNTFLTCFRRMSLASLLLPLCTRVQEFNTRTSSNTYALVLTPIAVFVIHPRTFAYGTMPVQTQLKQEKVFMFFYLSHG